MNQQAANSNAVNLSASHLPHCQHRIRGGRFCRLPIHDADSGLCFRHASLRSQQADSADLSYELTAGLADFKSAAPINDFLSRLLVLQAQGRVAPRRAAVMVFNCNQILHSLTAIFRENQAAQGAEPQIIFDIPRPDRD